MPFSAFESQAVAPDLWANRVRGTPEADRAKAAAKPKPKKLGLSALGIKPGKLNFGNNFGNNFSEFTTVGLLIGRGFACIGC